ncbi:transposase [Streptomyces sp. NBC_01185]|nr:transposase [Streptomyces sp. NBC_01185]
MIQRRRAVERTFGWLVHRRRLARDYETHPHRSEAMINMAMIDLMTADSRVNQPATGATAERRQSRTSVNHRR